MNVLIVGSGGREHAIAYCVAKSPKADKIYCTPGNAGIAEYAQCEPIGAMEFDKIVAFAKEKAIDLVIVGMDDPLVGGLVDELEAAGIRTFGPRKNAAILEGSKAFSKDLMKKYQRIIHSNDGKVYRLFFCKCSQLVKLHGCNRNTFCILRNSGVSRCTVNFIHSGALSHFPRKCMLSAAAANDQYFHFLCSFILPRSLSGDPLPLLFR